MSTPSPIAMLAELTHACPLSCPYCSNPVELSRRQNELSTKEWLRVFEEAASIGVLQLHLSGGEPASRRDLVELTKGAHDAGLYTNLITSGIGLTKKRLEELDAVGLDHIQLSLQGVNSDMADYIGKYKGGFERKMQVADWVKDIGIPLTLNVVLHKKNMEQIPEAINMALAMGARRVELATVQFHGWATKNAGALMPTKEQAKLAAEQIANARKEFEGQIVIDFVPADYHAKFPKSCMGGWGQKGLNVNPEGTVLPCHAAEIIEGMVFENVLENSLYNIWYKSSSFNRFRGDEWMPDLCRDCERKTVDFGGCRCQAMAILGDASKTDPVCSLSPNRDKFLKYTDDLINSDEELTYRIMPR